MCGKVQRTCSTSAHLTTKRQFEFYSTNSASSKGRTALNILNLNDHCFEKIFTYLNDSELLSIIRTNTRFKLPCEQAFKRQYCSDIVTVSNLDGTRLNSQKLMHSINILEHFGHLISKLRIRFNLEMVESLLEAVTANCDENLIELELHDLDIPIGKPSVLYSIGLAKIRSILSKLSTQFPMLHHFKMDYCNTSRICPYSDVVIQFIPTLKSFATDEASAGQIFTEKSLRKFFWLNRQLESVCLRMEVNELDDTDHSWYISHRFIEYLDRTLPLLKCVEINRVSTLRIPESAVYPVGFKNLEQLTFYSFLELQNVDCGFMSFLSESIEILKLSTFDVNIASFLKHVTQFKQLKTLELEYPLELASRMLSRDQTDAAVWSPHGIRQLILGSIQLTKIVVRQHPSEIDEEWIGEAECFDLKYQDIIKDKLNGHRWEMYGDSSCFSFRKMMEK